MARQTSDEGLKLDKLIVGVITGKTEFITGGVGIDDIYLALKDECPDSPPSKHQVFQTIELLTDKLLIQRLPDSTYRATDLDAYAKELGIFDLLRLVPGPR